VDYLIEKGKELEKCEDLFKCSGELAEDATRVVREIPCAA